MLIRSGLARWLPWLGRRAAGSEDFLHYYSAGLLASPYEELARAAGLLEQPDEPDWIDLSLGAPLFDLAPSGSTKLPADRRGFPPAWGLLELRQAVAGLLETQQQLNVRAEDEVLITHGVAGGFSVALDSFLNRGEGVVLFEPCSPLYRLALERREARLRWVTTWVQEGRLRFRPDLLARALAGARLIVLQTPVNPTGAELATEDVEEIAWWAERHDVLIFCDQAFVRYHYDSDPLNIGTLVKGHRRTLTAGSVSKGHGLTAARVGWLAGHRHLIRPCAVSSVLHTPFVPTLCQQIALSALRQPEESFAAMRADFEARRNYTCERLQAMGLKPVWPAGGYFVWVPVGGLGFSGANFAARLVAEHKVAVWPGSFFGPSGKEHIRLSFAGDDGRLREGLGRIAEFVRNAGGSAPAAANKKAA
jgi:aspartate/methionine/tyrosine aminotransferase